MHLTCSEANVKLRERVVKVSSKQRILSTKASFGGLLPANFTEFSEFAGRVVEALFDPMISRNDDPKQQMFYWLHKFSSRDSTERSASAGQYLSTLLLSEGISMQQGTQELVRANFNQLVFATQQYIFEMTPVGVPQTGIAAFWGRCDATNLRGCTQEMYDKHVCRCIESHQDLKDQIRFAIMDTRSSDAFEGIVFSPMDKMVDAVTKIVADSGKTITSHSDVTTVISILQARREFAEKITASMASASIDVQYLFNRFIDFQGTVKMVPFALALQLGILQGLVNYRTFTLRSGAIEKDRNDVSTFRHFITVIFVTGVLVTAIPLLVLFTLFFQGFTSYVFVIASLGLILLLAGYVYWSVRLADLDINFVNIPVFELYGPIVTQFLSYGMIVTGIFAWISSVSCLDLPFFCDCVCACARVSAARRALLVAHLHFQCENMAGTIEVVGGQYRNGY